MHLANPPPQHSGVTTAPAFQVFLPAIGGLGSVMFMVANGNQIYVVAGLLMVTATIVGGLAMFIASRTGARRAHALGRARYLEYLEEQRDELRDAAAVELAYMTEVHPDPQIWSALVRTPRVYERRPRDDDFLTVRVGMGKVPHPRQPAPPASNNPLERPDPVCQRAAMALAATHRFVNNVPITVPLADCESVVVRSADRAAALSVIRAMVVQLAAAHSPTDVHLGIASPRIDTDFAWAKWLPHVQDSHERDGIVPRRWLTASSAELYYEITDYVNERVSDISRSTRIGEKHSPTQRLVLIIDETETGPTEGIRLGDGATTKDVGMCVVRIVSQEQLEPGDVDARLVVQGDEVVVGAGSWLETPMVGLVDAVSPVDIETFVRSVAPLYPEAHDAIQSESQQPHPSQLLGVADPAQWNAAQAWTPRPLRDLLRVPIGRATDGNQLYLDLKESALGGMGPHGLLVGATGSGKSELLRSMVLSLAAHHDPQTLAMVLVDYKGGATFAGLEPLPHAAGMITNLEKELSMVDRMHDALLGELKRRQQLLLDAGNFANVYEYHTARQQRPDLPPLPHLVVIVDEFAELLLAKPDFIELFATIGRVGRSVGMYQLLASQRLDEGRMRNVESFMSYRFALRTFNADESRSILGNSDAFELPPVPGFGYLKVDTTVYQKFQATYVSAPYRPQVTAPIQTHVPGQYFGVRNTSLRYSQTLTDTEEKSAPDVAAADDSGPTILTTAVQRMAASAPSVHQIWLPPLPKVLSFGDVGARGIPASQGLLTATIGLLDLPAEQRQLPLSVNFTGAGGHLAILGGPQSGKSTTLRSIAAALASSHSPRQIAIHGVDFGGGTLQSLNTIPHVGTIAPRLDMNLVQRVFSEMIGELGKREAIFARHGFSSPDDLRRYLDQQPLPGIETADIFFFLDGYGDIKTDHDRLHDQLITLVSRGMSYGIHVVLTAHRWFDIRPAVQAGFSSCFELHLTDPMDSTIDRKAAENVGKDIPGRILVGPGLVGQVALPSAIPVGDDEGLTDERLREVAYGQQALIQGIAERWNDSRVSPIQLLPERVRLTELSPFIRHNSGAHRARTDHTLNPIILGMGEDTRDSVFLDISGEDQHLLIFGDRQSGKSSTLRLITQQLQEHHTDDEVVIALVDPRRSLLSSVQEDYLGAYAPNAGAAAGLAQSLRAELEKRLPQSMNPADLLNHQWTGPHIVCVIDDADLLFSMGNNPMAPIIEFAANSVDVGFHLIIARHAGGAGRAIYEQTFQRIKELGSPALLLSGDPEEGQLWPGIKMQKFPPGRGMVVRRGTPPRLLQVALPG